MERRFLAQIAVLLIAGIAVRQYRFYIGIPILAAVFLFMNYHLICNRHRQTFLILLVSGVAAFLAGTYFTEKEIRFRSCYEAVIEEEPAAELQGRLYKKESVNDQFQYYFKNVKFKINKQIYQTNSIFIYFDTDCYTIGTTLILKGNVKQFHSASNEGNFDQRKFYQSQKIDYTFAVKQVLAASIQKNSLGEYLFQLKEKLKHNYTMYANAGYSDIMQAMVCGDKHALESGTKEAYQDAGISHLLVISGLHISMIGLGLYELLRRLHGFVIPSTLLAVLGLFCYVCFAGNLVSARRAFLMFCFLSLARCVGRTYDRITAFCVTAAVLLIDNPFLLDYSGFRYSALAIGGVILAGEHAKGWKISLFIQILTIPLTAYYSYEIPVFGVVANLLVLPLSGVVVGSAVLGGAVSLFAGGLASVILLPAELILLWYEAVCKLIGHIPGNLMLTGCPSGVQIELYYLMFGVLWYVLSKRERKRSSKDRTADVLDPTADHEEKNHHAGNAETMKERMRQIVTGLRLLPAYVGMMLLGILLLSVKRTDGLTISVLDVGQGDGICMQLQDQTTVFVDGGSSDVSKAGAYRIEPFLKYHKIGKVDWWFVSHFDMDHVSGLLELLEEGYPVGHIVVAEGAVKNDSYDRVSKLAAQQKIPLFYMKEKDTLRLGRDEEPTVFTCLAPSGESAGTDSNAQSMVLLMRQGSFFGILTGDITKEQEQQLTKRWTQKKKLTWYKAAHHGSAGSNDEKWLKVLRPLVTTISYGEGNRYGHPAKEALDHITQTGSRIYRTAESGQISIGYRKGRLLIREYKN